HFFFQSFGQQIPDADSFDGSIGFLCRRNCWNERRVEGCAIRDRLANICDRKFDGNACAILGIKMQPILQSSCDVQPRSVMLLQCERRDVGTSRRSGGSVSSGSPRTMVTPDQKYGEDHDCGGREALDDCTQFNCSKSKQLHTLAACGCAGALVMASAVWLI